MWVFGAIGSVLFIFLILVDAFEAMVQPRRVMRRFRLAKFFYRTHWTLWRLAALYMRPGKHRESYLSLFGPLSMLALFVVWMLGLILGFAWLHYSLDTTLHTPETQIDFLTYVYLSGVTFSTLGFGDVVAVAPLGRMLTVAEASLGFGFLACVIGYLPAIFQAFSRREVTISLLDARAGSPPCRFPVIAVRRQGAQFSGSHSFFGRMGTLGRGTSGEPPLFSRIELLPVPA